jgi:PAS domain S-box-containing protein
MLVIEAETGAIKNANPAALKFFGHSLEQITGMNISGLGAGIHDLKRAHEQRRPLSAEFALPNGNVRYIEIRCGVMNENNAALLLAVVQDVTGRHTAERALEQERARGDAALREAQELANAALNEQTECAREALKDMSGRLEKMESIGKQAQSAAREFLPALSSIRDSAALALEELNASSPGYLELNEIKNTAMRAAGRAAELVEGMADDGRGPNENDE